LLTLTGVVADVSPQLRMDSVLIRAGLAQFVAGLPLRPWVWADSRDRVGAHLSNIDLLGLCAEWPAAALRHVIYGEETEEVRTWAGLDFDPARFDRPTATAAIYRMLSNGWIK
jgi:hypothetical protein